MVAWFELKTKKEKADELAKAAGQKPNIYIYVGARPEKVSAFVSKNFRYDNESVPFCTGMHGTEEVDLEKCPLR